MLKTYRALLGLALVGIITGCSGLPETITGVGNTRMGYTSYDPCIRCGESWTMLPNSAVAASNDTVEQPAEIEPRVIIIE